MFSIKSLNGNSIYEIAATIEQMQRKERAISRNPSKNSNKQDFNYDELSNFLEEFDLLNTKILRISKKSDFDVITSVDSEYSKEVEYYKELHDYETRKAQYIQT